MDSRLEPMPWQREATRDWQERFEALGRAKGVVDNAIDASNPTSKMTDLFLTHVGKEAYSQVKVLLAPVLPSSLNYSQIKDAIDSHLSPKVIEIAERYKFHQIRQNNDSVATFVSNLRRAAETCSFGAQLESMLRDRFVIGLSDETIVQKLLLENTLTLETAIKIASSSEEVKKCQAIMRQSSIPDVNKVQSFKKPPKQAYDKPKQGFDKQKIFKDCDYCGQKHARKNCPAYGKRCVKCKKLNHFAIVCKSNNVAMVTSDCDETILSVLSSSLPNKILIDVKINGCGLKMLVDTGATQSLLPLSFVQERPRLNKASKEYSQTLLSYTGGHVTAVKKLTDVHLQIGSKTCKADFLVVTAGQPLLGMDIIRNMNLLNLNVNEVREMEAIDYATIEMKQDVIPKFCKPRKLPYALEEHVKLELDRLENAQIIQKVKSSEWATPIVVVHKPNGKIRICGDYQSTINPHILSSVVTGLDINDTLDRLHDCVKFTKIDLTDAYLHVKLDEASQMLTVISTPFGLYKYLSLPFGVKSAPYIFQSRLQSLFKDLNHVSNHLDDILIATPPEVDHKALVEEVEQRLKLSGFPINEQKSTFYTKEIRHLGYLIKASINGRGSDVLPDPPK